MERRILLAFTLSFLVFIGYLRFFAPKPRPTPVPVPQEEKAPEPDLSGAPQVSRPPTEAEAAPELVGGSTERREAATEQEISVETPLYRALLSNRGANLRSFLLKGYKDAQGRPYEMVPAEASRRLGVHPLDIELETAEQTKEVREALFEVSGSGLALGPGEEGSLAFEWSDGRGLQVVKRLEFEGSTYEIHVEISARFGAVEVRKSVLYGPGVGEAARSGSYVQPEKGVLQASGELKLFRPEDIAKGHGAAVDVAAVGVSSHYFAALMLPATSRGCAARLSSATLEPAAAGERPRSPITAGLEVPSGSPATLRLFLGPKEHDLLVRLGPGMDAVIEYGPWMRYLALPLRAALLWIHAYVGNYGWSIVILTVLINVALVPLKHHSYVSMRKMQKLAPQVKRIQEKYKKLKPTDPRQQEKNKELYGLYRENNVSPLSGCLPLLLMIPFFFAFYRLLVVSIELRQAPFVLWVKDLSVNDPYFVLPILMGVTQIAIQKMSPQTSADPVQAKIMMFMPVMFIFILAWAPAGLVLYWFVNNLVSIGQQVITNRVVARGEGKAAPDASRARAGKA